MINIVDEFFKDQINMWLENYEEDMEFEDYTKEDLENVNIDDIVHWLRQDEYMWDYIDNRVRHYINEELEKLIKERGNKND